MAIRPGSYNANPPWWRGVLREGSWGIWACLHRDHRDQQEATRCARAAWAEHRPKFEADEAVPGWEPIGRSKS
jgi:hypothetical protein